MQNMNDNDETIQGATCELEPLPDQQVVLDQAIAMLRCLRGRSPESALALANEVMGY